MAQGQEMDGVVEGVPVKLAGCDNVEGGDDNDDIGDSVCCVPCPSSLNVSSRFSLSFSFFPLLRFLPPCDDDARQPLILCAQQVKAIGGVSSGD